MTRFYQDLLKDGCHLNYPQNQNKSAPMAENGEFVIMTLTLNSSDFKNFKAKGIYM